MVKEGLRERKRAETRQRISDCATRLFERDGFENVTLAQVAQAADVSVKTVVNYFGAKEDLFFDAEPAILDALVDSLGNRGPASPTAALRPLLMDGPLLTAPCPWSDLTPGLWEAGRVWARCEQGSPTLRTRRAAILKSWLRPLAQASGSLPWAALMVGALILRHDLLHQGLLDGSTPAEVERRFKQTLGHTLDALDRAFPSA
ncbi:TetR/AcrR family transcriptional regulator [Nonomuraea candida]|uniref:TetR/AcrR family transcriptional regulator n=1 Tax=Nonomuraea candida TaxID=359159 RepID=UPI0005BAAEAD|nr:TetR/AcrR family transcriptional regulator [Nonomuraea candida]